MIYKKFLCCVSLLLLSSCTFMTNTAPAPERLTDLLKQNLVLLPDNNFEHLPSDLKENEIIFLGEIHKVIPLIQAAERFAVYLATSKPVVYAMELCYGLGPFVEAASLGHPKKAKQGWSSKYIQAFNSKQTADRKILMTAIDIEHTIYHTKSDTVLFLQDLAGRSTSDVARGIIQKEIPQLTTQDTFGKVKRYLKNLKGLFLQHFDTFSPEDQDEIVFSLDLLQASNRYHQYDVAGGITEALMRPWDIRQKYFTKTIKRAYRKAQKRKAVLLCRVGASHINLGRKTEARYFARDYSLTKGKVVTIRLAPLYYDTTKVDDADAEKHSDIDSIVKVLMKDYKYSYLSLSELQQNTNTSFKWSKYYSSSGPKYDGLLFVKIEENSN